MSKSKALTKSSMCLLARSGVELWVTQEQMKKIDAILDMPNPPKFIKMKNGERINIVDLEGIYNPETMEKKRHLRYGDYMCDWGEWHGRMEECFCTDKKK